MRISMSATAAAPRSAGLVIPRNVDSPIRERLSVRIVPPYPFASD